MIRIDLKRGYSVEVNEIEKEDVNEIDILGNYSKSNYNATAIVNKNGIAPTVRENHGQVTGIIVKGDTMLKGGKQLSETIAKNIDKFKEGECLSLDLYNRSVNDEVYSTLSDPKHNSQRLFDGYRIRKLTPRECWRLMSFNDQEFDRASEFNTDTQLYKQAGNSIVVDVLVKIFRNLLCKEEK